MTIQEQIKADLHSAMKSKDTLTTSLLRVVMGEFLRVKDLPADKSVTNEQAIKVLRKMSQDAKDNNLLEEVEILKDYIPKVLSEDELTNIIKNIITLNSCKNIGEVMKHLKSSGLLYDGKMASELIKKLL